MSTKDKAATPLTEEQLLKREAQLKQSEQKLSDDQAQLTLDKNTFEEQKANFEEEKEKFKDRVEQINEKESELQTRHEELEEREAALDPDGTVAVDIVEDFDFEDEEYQFAPGAPETIRHGGQVFTRAELIENHYVLEQLIGGNSSLIIKKK